MVCSLFKKIILLQKMSVYYVTDNVIFCVALFFEHYADSQKLGYGSLRCWNSCRKQDNNQWHNNDRFKPAYKIYLKN